MAKILPAGANVNLNLGKDPMDRLMETIDLVSKVGGAFQQAQDRREASKIRRKNQASADLQNLLNLTQKAAPYMNNEVQNELDIQSQQVFNEIDEIDDPILNIEKNLSQQIINGQKISASNFKDVYENYELDFKSHPIFNLKNYNKKEFQKAINDMGPDGIKELLDKSNYYKSSLLNVDNNGNYSSKMSNYKNSNNLGSEFNLYDNIIANMRNSLDEDGIMADAEFMYMARGLTTEEMDSLREDIIKQAETEIKASTNIINDLNKMSLTLSQKKDRSAMSVVEDLGKIKGTEAVVRQFKEAVGKYGNQSIASLQDELDSQKLVGSTYDRNLENVLNLFEQYEDDIQTRMTSEVIRRNAYVKRFDEWSLFDYAPSSTTPNKVLKDILED